MVKIRFKNASGNWGVFLCLRFKIVKSLLHTYRISETFFIFKIKMIKEGTKVQWKWGNGTATGKVITTYTKEVTKTIKGNEVTRKGEKANKALYIEQEDGDTVLKVESEVTRAN